MNAPTEFQAAKVLQLSRKLGAHLHQRSRNKVTEAMHQLRQASRLIDTAMQQGTIDAEATRALLRGMAEAAADTERELAADIAEDNRVLGER